MLLALWDFLLGLFFPSKKEDKIPLDWENWKSTWHLPSKLPEVYHPSLSWAKHGHGFGEWTYSSSPDPRTNGIPQVTGVFEDDIPFQNPFPKVGQLSFPEGVGVFFAKKFPKFGSLQILQSLPAFTQRGTQGLSEGVAGNDKCCQGWHVDIQHPYMNTKIPNLSRKKQPNKSIIIGTKTIGGLNPNQTKTWPFQNTIIYCSKEDVFSPWAPVSESLMPHSRLQRRLRSFRRCPEKKTERWP